LPDICWCFQFLVFTSDR